MPRGRRPVTAPLASFAISRTPRAAPAASLATPSRSGKYAHLLRLAPCLIDCIGQPVHLHAIAPMPPAVLELAACVRRLLHIIAATAWHVE